MAKRTNPFTEDYVPQSKVHIGVKQFNNNEDRLQKVYEKTLQLLFKGAKKKSATENNDYPNTTPAVKDRMKQLFIGKDGSLLHSGTMVENACVLQCACGGDFVSYCSYCEKVLCSKCRHHCASCDKFYCSHCALIGSEGSQVCVSCYS